MRCSLHPLALVLAMASATGAQGLPKPGANPPRDTPSATAATAQLSGRVVAADTGKPLPRAIVQAAEPGAREPRWAWTDANGRWQISQVRAGRYDLTVSKTGYLTLRYGQLRAFEPGKVIEVTAGQRLERLDVALPRAGAISGRIHDEYGDPVAGVVARALRVQYVDGRPRLTPIGTGLEALLSSGFTDDIGRYRIHGLPPGAYVIQAAIGQPRIPPGEADDRTSYAPTYYPGTGSSADAQRITLGVGEDLPNIDLQLLPVRHVTLSGTAVSSSGQPPARASVELLAAVPDAMILLMTEPKMTVGADGTFTVTSVPPGEYRLRISVPAPSGREFGIVSVTAGDRDVTGIAVVTAPAATLSGRAVSESGKPLPETLRFAAVSTTAAPSVPITTPVLIEPNGTFEMRGLVDKHLFVLSEPSRGWFLKSVTIDGKDVSDSGYEFRPGERVSGMVVTLTDQPATLAGTVEDDRRRPLGDYTVVVFPADRARWASGTRSVRAVRPDQNGRFEVKGLPAGEYRAVAVDYLEPGAEADPDRLEKWATIATRVTLADGESKSITIMLIR